MISSLVKKITNKIRIICPNLFYLKTGKSVRPLYRALRPYYILRSFRPFWFYFANKRSRKLHEEDKKQLSNLQERMVGEMKEKGIAVTHLDELFPGRNLLPKLQAYARSLVDNGQRREKGKTYIVDFWNKMEVLDLENPFIKFTLSPEVLAIANGYMDMRSKFFMYNLNLVSPVGNAEPISSQRWHRDPEDKKLFKVFIYLNDVDGETGPFTYFMGSHADGKWGRKFPQWAPRGRINISENSVKNLAGPKGIKVVTGKAGSVVFCDTAGIHRGGYAKSKERLMFTGGFCSTASLWLPKFVHPRKSEIEKLSNLVKYALTPWY